MSDDVLPDYHHSYDSPDYMNWGFESLKAEIVVEKIFIDQIMELVSDPDESPKMMIMGQIARELIKEPDNLLAEHFVPDIRVKFDRIMYFFSEHWRQLKYSRSLFKEELLADLSWWTTVLVYQIEYLLELAAQFSPREIHTINYTLERVMAKKRMESKLNTSVPNRISITKEQIEVVENLHQQLESKLIQPI